jgi:hypothetical protein
MPSIPNEFTTSNSDNSIRPWTRGVLEHNDPLATIILFSDGMNAAEATSKDINLDYTKDLSKRVNSFVTEATNGATVSGDPNTPQPLIFGTVSRRFSVDRVQYDRGDNQETFSEGDTATEIESVTETMSGGKIPVFSLDGKNDYYGVFNNFSLLSFTEAHNQITKIHMNLGSSWNVFFLGNSPNIYQFSGYFLDTKDYPYYQEFLVAYEKVLSGRKSVENHMQTKIMVAGQLIDGYLLNVNVSHNANNTAIKEFQFTMLVKGVSWIRSNLITPLGERTRLEFNGLSNLARLSKNFHEGLVDNPNENSMDAKTARYNVTWPEIEYPPESYAVGSPKGLSS